MMERGRRLGFITGPLTEKPNSIAKFLAHLEEGNKLRRSPASSISRLIYRLKFRRKYPDGRGLIDYLSGGIRSEY
jgi:hypothetical protein